MTFLKVLPGTAVPLIEVAIDFMYDPTVQAFEVPNGDFETNITGWTAIGAATLTHDGTMGYDSAGSMKIVTTGASQGAECGGGVCLVSAGTLYLLAMWVYSAAGGSTVQLFWDENVGAGYNNTKSGAATLLVAGWNLVTMSATTAAGVTSVNPYIETAAAATVWVDHVGDYAFVDITPYLVSYSRDPVRTNEFDQPQPTNARLKLRNDDSRFTPDNAAGPYYGELKKIRRCRVRAQWGGTIYNRFWGYVQDWPQSWDEYGRDQSVSLTLQDSMFPLGTYDLAGQDLAGTTSGEAIATILAQAGAAAWDLDTGRSVIADSGTLNPRSFALQRVRDIAASENGVVFGDGGGTIRFHDRTHRLVDYGSVMGTIGDAAGEIPYDSPQPMFGDAWPVVNITPYGGTAFVVSSDAAGTAAFFQQTLTFPPAGTYLVASSAEALEAAQYLSRRYAAPVTRVASVELIGARDPTQWAAILSLDVSERIIFRRRFLSNGTIGGTVEVNGFVEGYADSVEIGKDWRVSVPISPADLQEYWLLGDATFGLLGDTTVLGY